MNSVMVKLFAASSAVGFVVSLLLALANVPIISGFGDWIMDAIFDGSEGFARMLGLMFLSAISSIAWGIYYAICLRKFEN